MTLLNYITCIRNQLDLGFNNIWQAYESKLQQRLEMRIICSSRRRSVLRIPQCIQRAADAIIRLLIHEVVWYWHSLMRERDATINWRWTESCILRKKLDSIDEPSVCLSADARWLFCYKSYRWWFFGSTPAETNTHEVDGAVIGLEQLQIL